MTSKKMRLLLVLGVMFLSAWIFHHAITPRIGFIILTGDRFLIQDFAYHIILTEQLLTRQPANLYNPELQMAVLSAYVASSLRIAMPVGVTPVAFFVWIPFAFLSRVNLPLSYTLWIVFSVTCLMLSIWKMLGRQKPFSNGQILSLILIALSVFSAVGFLSVLPGQTSILAAGLISLLIYHLHESRRETSGKRSWWIVMIVFFSCLKPTYMIICFGALLIYGKKKEFITAGAFLALFLAVITPFLTKDWIPFYVKNLGMYLLDNYPDFYTWSVVPKTMNTFSGAFGQIIGRQNANRISLVALILTWLWVFRMPRLRTAPDCFSWLILNKSQRLILLIAGCLLFAPYSGAYEDLLFVPVFVTFGLSGREPKLLNGRIFFLCCGLIICMFHNISLLSEWLWVVFILKAVVLGSMVAFCGRQPASAMDENSRARRDGC